MEKESKFHDTRKNNNSTLIPKQSLTELQRSVSNYEKLPKKKQISGLKSLIKNEIDRLQVLYSTIDTAIMNPKGQGDYSELRYDYGAASSERLDDILE